MGLARRLDGTIIGWRRSTRACAATAQRLRVRFHSNHWRKPLSPQASSPASAEAAASHGRWTGNRGLWLAIALCVLVVGAGGVWWWSMRGPPAIVWQGYAEADFVKVGPTQQGLLTDVFVKRGDEVVIGAPLFAQDDADDRAARDHAEQMLMQAVKQLDRKS